MRPHKNIRQALAVLESLGLPRAQLNERSALCLLALLDLRKDMAWSEISNPLMGITPIMDWVARNYRKRYAPNIRETFRRQTMHQFLDAGLVLYNPDNPDRPVNSPMAVYQIEPSTLDVLRHFGGADWVTHLERYQSQHASLAHRYAKERELRLIPVTHSGGLDIKLSPGKHSELLKAIVDKFAPQFMPDSHLVYVGDTGGKWAHCDHAQLAALSLDVDPHGKMPDVILYCPRRNWLVLVEAVTSSHGPVDPKRHAELARLFADSTAGLVYVTAFPTRSLMAKHLAGIAWETEVWVAESPSHLIHFNGIRYLGPYD